MIILGTNSIKDTGYNVANSLRFNDGSSDYLSRSNGTPTSLRKYTFSAWVKKTATGVLHTLYSNGTNGDNYMYIHFNNSTEQLEYVDVKSGEYQVNLKTTRAFKDPSAWYHIMIAVDTTQGTNTNRVKFYINGVQETSFVETTYPDQNDDLILNGSNTNIGRYVIETDRFYDGYMSEVVFVDGTQQANTDLGEFDDSGIWKPIDVSGLTFGDNGYYLEFKQAGTSQNSSGMGADTSGEDNHFAVSNLTAVDQSVDTCTNNFATMNPLAYRLDSGVSLPTYSEGNTVVSYADDSGAGKSTMATIGFQNGKWYWEYKVGTANDTIFGGITRMDYDPNDNFAGRSCYYNKTGAFSVGTGTGGTADANYGDSYTTDDIIGVAFDCDNGVIWFSKNGTWQNSATIAEIGAGTTTNSATTGITLNQFWSPFFEGANGGISANFGSPAYAISSGNTDGDGYGNFEYAVPSGYFAINTKNLAEYG